MEDLILDQLLYQAQLMQYLKYIIVLNILHWIAIPWKEALIGGKNDLLCLQWKDPMCVTLWCNC